MLQLIKPDIVYKESFEAFLESFGDLKNAHGSGIYDRVYKGIDEFLERIDKSEKGILPGYEIPATAMWLVNDETVVGTVNIRHSLNDFLLREGGHVGYSIHSGHRGKGYGNEILKLSLEKLKNMGIKKVLVTCDDDNIPSEKVILRNGGVYENTIEGTKRFWIDNK